MIQPANNFERSSFDLPSIHSLARSEDDKTLFADGSLSLLFIPERGTAIVSVIGRISIGWPGVLLKHDLRWREPLHAFNVRSPFEEDIMIVIVLYQKLERR